ncbi:hypothetical protein CcaverHIS002_0500980 [Cutaneotrichosporon cavernicola]|uniref:Uncharacterized protein n=1 Tax=Cutaneotrichosporon cavernicola TaxID=279322 RepID=A0AA48L7Z4_9TREE|nr:uncharacterized protein CcaverHIS019_0600980 [Cutaneotrichosporon cavernicola]BEI84697.1 hypothetical protein CcaverHIS002_0500980 [Cutaneotrichosporon cavernicola]BEI93639.1 hypothetical protein CcaverHIS019_0600980 [Cutaneotrichosporon cavernicola]BEJ01416.1 hypothetical protein CcaverHIS631_0600980 [Cutaneotrichosporon cavernicola]BEJ09183.1 hypothetical protein CcaverHIS641_0600980 [Cutaneotrichosporon cavernicola]
MSQPPAPTPASTPGPSAATFKRSPERAYTGPSEHAGLGPRAGASAAEAERYFAKLPEATQPIMPRTARALGIGSWIVGGFACGYMILFADYGPHEHVFSPIRRMFHKYTAEMFTLSKSERGMLGLEDATVTPTQASQPALTAGSARVAPPPTQAPEAKLMEEVKAQHGRSWWKLW